MPFTLAVDTPRWRRHLDAVAAQVPGLVPVVKGNGYGPGLTRLAAEATRLGVDTVAVGTSAEAAVVGATFPGRILVLAPRHPALPEPPVDAALAARVVATVASPPAVDAVRSGQPATVVVELLSSVRRHGVGPADLAQVVTALPTDRRAGFALHLPLRDGRRHDAVGEVRGWVHRLREVAALPGTLWLSHVDAADLARLRAEHPDVAFRARVGTRLWLGDPGAMAFRSTVCDAHRLRRGERFGYRGRRAPHDGTLVVLSGGTAHGLSLSAPRFVRGLRARLALGAEFGLAELNRTRGPFEIAGRRPLLAEPPHMQVSLVLLPDGVPVPPIGSEVPVRMRATTASPDAVVEVGDAAGVTAALPA